MNKNEFMKKYSSHEFVKCDCELEEDVDSLLKQEREKVIEKVRDLTFREVNYYDSLNDREEFRELMDKEFKK